MPATKSVETIAAKWARVAPQRQEDYVQGVSNPRKDWASSAANAAETHKQAMVKAAANGAYARGINAAGTAKWKSRAIAKGGNRFGEGVQIAEPDYRAGVAPYLEVINRTALPQRYPKGDPRNLDRVKGIAIALHTKKTGGVA